MPFDQNLISRAEAVIARCAETGYKLVTAESCTGGLIAAVLTEVPGASDVIDRGFVTYSNEAKSDVLGVPADMIAAHGAVSEQVARAMAEGALDAAAAGIAIAVTGIAGPAGATPGKPVGLVHIACAGEHQPTVHVRCDFGPAPRSEIRERCVLAALDLILAQAAGPVSA